MAMGQHANGASTTFNPGSTTSVATNSSGLAPFTNLNVHVTSVNYTILATVNKNPSGIVEAEREVRPRERPEELQQQDLPGRPEQLGQPDVLHRDRGFDDGCEPDGNPRDRRVHDHRGSEHGQHRAGLNGQAFGVAIGLSGTAADYPVDPAAKPTFTIVTRIDKSIVKNAPGPNGATKFDICLGAVNTITGLTSGNACANPTTDPSFPTKSGGCAVRRRPRRAASTTTGASCQMRRTGRSRAPTRRSSSRSSSRRRRTERGTSFSPRAFRTRSTRTPSAGRRQQTRAVAAA